MATYTTRLAAAKPASTAVGTGSYAILGRLA